MNHSVIDMHVHLLEQSARRDADVLRAMLDRYDIAWLGVIPIWGNFYPTEDDIRAGNAATVEFCNEDRQRRRPFVTVNPRHEKSTLHEIRRGAEEHGAIAVKVWVAARADEPVMFPLAEACIKAGAPLLLHAWHKTVGQMPHETDAQHVALLAKRYPELKLIMAHLAGNHLWGCAHIADCPNVWSDFSGTYCETGTIETAVKLLGEDRVLFGSDAPGADYLNNLGKVQEAALTEQQRRKILHDNAAKLFLGCNAEKQKYPDENERRAIEHAEQQLVYA